MEHKLIFDMVLESHDEVVPDGAESILVFAHHRNDASINMCIEVPALDVAHVAPLDWHSKADWNR